MHIAGKLGGIDSALFVAAPPADTMAPSSFNLKQIDSLFDDQIKSWYYLLRELEILFSKRSDEEDRGSIVLVLEQSRSLSSASFRDLGDSLLSGAGQINFDVYAFINEAEGPKDSVGFADYVFKTLDAATSSKKSGSSGGQKRWYRFGKRKLFGLYN
jgi:hypothetical protein